MNFSKLKRIIKNGDGEIDLEECADLLDQKADQYGLSKKGEAFAAKSDFQVIAGDLFS